jgi:hypothetical protein
MLLAFEVFELLQPPINCHPESAWRTKDLLSRARAGKKQVLRPPPRTQNDNFKWLKMSYRRGHRGRTTREMENQEER